MTSFLSPFALDCCFHFDVKSTEACVKTMLTLLKSHVTKSIPVKWAVLTANLIRIKWKKGDNVKYKYMKIIFCCFKFSVDGFLKCFNLAKWLFNFNFY